MKTLQFKRYSQPTANTIVGAVGEIIIDLTSDAVTVHDGSTPGGIRQATEAYVNNALNSVNGVSANAAFAKANSANVLAQAAFDKANTGSSSYGNSNVASYLSTYSGPISANTLTATETADLGSLHFYGPVISMADDTWDNIFISPNGESYAYLQVPKDSVANTENVRLHNDIGNVEIGTNGGSKLWYFDGSGKLTAPGEVYGKYFTIRGGNPSGSIGTLGYSGDDVALDATGNITITTSDAEVGPQWIFGNTGKLNLPNLGGVIYPTITGNGIVINGERQDSSAAVLVLPHNADAVTDPAGLFNGSGNVEINATNNQWLFGGNGNFKIPGNITSETNINLIAGSETFTFGTDGGLNVPQNLNVTGNSIFQNSVTFNGTVTIPGTINQVSGNSGVYYGYASNGAAALFAGYPGYTQLPDTVFQTTGYSNGYMQNNFQNLNPGTQASAEWVITADNGSDSTAYIDYGIAGSGWDGSQTNSLGTAVTPNDGWIYVQNGTGSTGGHLILGTTTPNKHIKFVAGGPNSGNIVAEISNTGLYVGGTNIINAINSSYAHANASFVQANTPSTIANSAAAYANGAFAQANIALIQSNTPSYTANSSASYANSAFAHANAAFNQANTGGAGTDSWVREQANAAFIHANAAFIQANTGGAGTDSWVREQTNSVFLLANTSANSVTAAFITANAAFSKANTFANTANASFITANAAFLKANTPPAIANSAAVYANGAFIQANAAFLKANTSANNLGYSANSIIFANSTGYISNTTGFQYVMANATLIVANVLGTTANTTITAGSYVTTFDTYGKLTLPGDLSVAGNLVISGIQCGYSAARPAFRVYGSGTSSWGTSVNTDGYLNSNQYTVDFNQGSFLNTTTGVFTAPVGGLYQIYIVGRNASDASYSQLGVVKNATGGNGAGGTICVMLEFGGSSTMNHAGAGTILQMAAGDTLVLKVLSGTIQFDSNDNWSIAYLG